MDTLFIILYTGEELAEYRRKESERKAAEALQKAADTIESDEEEEEGKCLTPPLLINSPY